MSGFPHGLNTLSAGEIVQGIQVGHFTVEQLTRTLLERIADREPAVRAWAYLDPDEALAKARAMDRSPRRGPLYGLPIAVKDIIETADMPTGHNTPIPLRELKHGDAACVSILKSAGAFVLGKTETVEFGAFEGALPATRNPRDLARTPGGSSSGSAAAVADHQVPVALGTQTGGSTIRPASLCGTFAFKPTWGVVSREGIMPYAPSLDTVGWFGRSVEDLALLAKALGVPGQPRPQVPEIRDLSVAICKGPEWFRAAPETVAAMGLAERQLIDAGARVFSLKLPQYFQEIPQIHQMMMCQEGASSFMKLAHSYPDVRSRCIEAHMEIRSACDLDELRKAYDLAARARHDFDNIAASFDFVLTPSAIGFAPIEQEQEGASNFNRMWTLLQTPCVNVPIEGLPLPLGLTFTARKFADWGLLSGAAACAKALRA